METKVLQVKGMTCTGCVNSVKNVLKPLPGVQSVDVTLENGEVKVTYDPVAANTSEFKAVIEDAGFEVAS
jgi:copper chaperone